MFLLKSDIEVIMTSLASLPVELLDLILVDLASPDLASICSTCKRLNAAGTPVLYRAISLTWKDNELVDPEKTCSLKTSSLIEATVSLIRTLLMNPDRLDMVKSLELCADHEALHNEAGEFFICWTLDPMVLSREDKKMFYAAVDELRLADAQRWKAMLDQCPINMNVVMALLIAVCRNLESLSVYFELLMHNEVFEWLMKDVQDVFGTSKTTRLLKKLTRVSVTGTGRGRLWGEHFSTLRNTYLCLLSSPTIETLELSAFADDELIAGPVWAAFPVQAWPYNHTPQPHNLTTLRILRSALSSETIGFILTQTQHLHTFDLDIFRNQDTQPYDLAALHTALTHIRSTLTHLTIRYEILEDDEDSPVRDLFNSVEGGLGPLREFPCITSLSVSLAVLYGRDVTDSGAIPPLASYLPPLLQRLVVTDDLLYFGEFQGYFEDVDAMAIFRAYLSGERLAASWKGGRGDEDVVWEDSGERAGWETATPGLREFEYDVRRFGGLLSRGYWERRGVREELGKVGRERGVKVRVRCR